VEGYLKNIGQNTSFNIGRIQSDETLRYVNVNDDKKLDVLRCIIPANGLAGLNNKQRPLAIYYDYDKKKTMNICSYDSKRPMQNTVCLEYDITDIKELSKWTNHSIRVGMACLPLSQGKAGDYIQRALRWCSETWKLYTCNLWSESI
jgi:hypothetical protein